MKDNSFGISSKSNTDRKYNLLSLDQNKLISKPKTEKAFSIDKTQNNNN